MKAILLQENLQKAISLSGHLISSKAQLPILENVLLEAEKTNLVFSATNLESSIVIQVPAKIEKAGKICLPAKTLQEVTPLLLSDKVFLEQKQEKMEIRCGKTFMEIKGVETGEFPPIPQKREREASWKIKSEDLEKTCLDVVFAASTDEGRPVLGGIKINIDGKEMEMAATDGYRLSKKKFSLGERKETESFVVPAKTFSEAVKILAKEAEEIYLCLDKKQGQLILFTENIYITCRLIEGEFPPFAKIIPKTCQTTAVLDKEELVRALKIASVFSRESANIVRFKVSPNEKQVKISANAPLVGENESEIESNSEGEEVEIAFNFRFLLEFLSVITAEQIKIKFNGSLSPVVFEAVGNDSFFHLIMPVRLQPQQ